MGWLKTAIPFVFAALLLSSASAKVSIEYITPSKIAFQPNSLGEVYIRVNNNAQNDEYLFVDYEVSGAKYRDFWHLGPNQGRTFTLYIQAPTKEGIYDVKITASNKWNSVNGAFEIIVAPVEFNFVVDIEPDYISVDAGEMVNLNLGIANVGTKPDVYGIVVPEDVKIGANIVEISGSNITHIPVQIVSSETDDIGGRVVEMRICSLTDLEDLKCKTTSATIVLTKEEFLQSLVALESDEVFTYSDSASFSLEITNLGIQDKTYLVEVESDENATVIPNPETFTLEPGAKQKVDISVIGKQKGLQEISYSVYANGIKISENPLYVMFSDAGLTGAFVSTVTNPWFFGILAVIIISIVVIYLLWPKQGAYPY